jgi:glutamine synthetase
MACGITTLPGSLNEAIEAAPGSALLREALGEHVFASLPANKRIEWDQFRRHITNYELTRYLPTL